MHEMANKKNGSKESDQDQSSSNNELSQLRAIVFGAAEDKFLAQLSTLRADMESSVDALSQQFAKKISDFQQNNEDKHAEIDKRISFVDKAHDDNENNIQKSLDNLYSEHEMFANTTQLDIKNLNQSIDNESSMITSNFSQQLDQLKTHLEEVSKELTTSKTDRKTLAKLLATMATNLEDDQL